MYFVISNSDGDTHVTPYKTKEQLLKALSDDCYTYRTDLSEEDTNYWEDDILIIKGEIVVPVEKARVVELDID